MCVEAVVEQKRASARVSIEVVIYFGFLIAFVGLLVAASEIFGLNPLGIVFGGFILVVLGVIVAMDRLLG